MDPGKIGSAARNWINFAPQTDATTFALSSAYVHKYFFFYDDNSSSLCINPCQIRGFEVQIPLLVQL